MKRAAGEFPRFCWPRAPATERLDHGGDNGAAAMDMEFGIVLARKTFWRGEKKHEPFVDGFARGGIAEGCERRHTGLRAIFPRRS